MIKFKLAYLGLLSNAIALIPIIFDDEDPKIHLPSMLVHACENIALSLIEIIVGYISVKYYIPGRLAMIMIFLMKYFMKTILSVSTLSIYAKLYALIYQPSFFNEYPPIGNCYFCSHR